MLPDEVANRRLHGPKKAEMLTLDRRQQDNESTGPQDHGLLNQGSEESVQSKKGRSEGRPNVWNEILEL